MPHALARGRELGYEPGSWTITDHRLPACPSGCPPAIPEAEQALLGALLANNKAYGARLGLPGRGAFRDRIHGRIFQAIARRCEQNQVADPITLRAELEHSGVLAEVGGTAYLAQLLSAMVGITRCRDYGRLIHDAWLRRSSSMSAR